MPIQDPSLRRKRLIRLTIVAVVMICIAGGVFTLFQLNRTDRVVVTDEQRIAEAEQAFDLGEYDRVVELLESQTSPANTIAAIDDKPEALRMYITARRDIPMFEKRHLARTVAPLTKLIALDTDKRSTQNELLDVLIELERFDDAIKHAAALTELYPDDASLYRRLADAQLKRNRRDAALASLYRAAELEPLHVATFAKLLDIVRDYGESTEPLIEIAETVYNTQPEDPRAMMIQAIAQNLQGNNVQARDLLERASRETPPDQETVVLLVRWLDSANLFALSGSYLQEHAEPGIASPAARQAIYRAFESEDYDAILTRVKGSDPTRANSDLVAMWASALIATDRRDAPEIEALLKVLNQRGNPVAQTWATLLKLDLDDRAKPAMIIDTIVDALASEDASSANALTRQHAYFAHRLGLAYLETLEDEAAYAALIVAARNSRTWAKPHRGLAEALLKIDQPEAAFFHAREAVRREDTALSRQWLVLATIAAINPKDTQQVDQAIAQADRLDMASPEGARVLPALIDMLVRANRQEQAKQLIADALALQGPISVQLLESLAQLSQQHRLDATERIASTLQAQHGMTRGLALIRANQVAKEDGFNAGFRVLTDAAPEPMTKSWRAAMAGYVIANQPEEAVSTLIDLANTYPDDITLQLSALQASNPRLHPEFFEQAIQRLRENAGEHSIHWRLHEARLGAQDPGNTARLNEIIERLSHAERLTPLHLELNLTLARLHLLLDQNSDALEHAEAAKAINARDAQAMMLYGKSLYNLQRYDEARVDLLTVARSSTIDPALRIEACTMLYQNGEREVVRQVIESLRENDQANNSALILLAQVYLAQNERALADEVCEELLRRPDAQAIRFATNYYRQTGRPELAEQTLLAAQASNVSEADRLAIRAQDAASQGQNEQAIAFALQSAEREPTIGARWVNAIRLALSLGEPAEAMRLAELSTPYLPNDAGIAGLLRHRSLAMRIADDRSLTPLVIAILDDDRHRAAAVQAMRMTAGDSEPAQIAEALEELAQDHPDFKHLTEIALDRLLQAGLDARASGKALAAMARFSDSAASARVATLAAYRVQDWAAALSAADAWARRNPADRPSADLMRAAAMIELDRQTAAIRVLAPYVAAMQTLDAKQATLLDLYTRALVRVGDTDRAWQALSAFVPGHPEARSIALKRIADDILQPAVINEWLDRLSAQPDASADAFPYVTATFTAGQRLNDKPLVLRSEQMIERLLASSAPNGVDVVYAQGQIAQHLGNFEKAEASYRVVLESLPNNPLVLNNLAVVLTEQGRGLPEAERLALRAIQLSSDDPNLRDTLALVYLRQNEHGQAMQAIEKAIEMDPANATWRLTKAKILEDQGDTEDAQILRERYGPRP